MRAVTLSMIFALLGASAGRASAQPLEPPPPPPRVTLGAGTLSAQLSTELALTSGATAEPVSLAPDVSYGVTRDLTLSIVTSTFATTGFRGAAGAGFCVTGSDAGCSDVAVNAGVEGLYALTTGTWAMAANAGLHAGGFDPFRGIVKLGFKGKLTAGRISVNTAPSVFIGVTERDAMPVPNKEQLWLPVSASVLVVAGLSAGAGTGIKGPIDGFTDRWTIPVGVLAQYAFVPSLTAGSSFVFGKIVGGSDVADDGTDARALHVWLTYTHAP